MSTTWKTKYGSRRVRNEPPALAEAIEAARGMTDDLDQQVEFAASLMDMPADQVRAAIIKAGSPRQDRRSIAFTGRGGARAVVVERKPSRRIGLTGLGARATR